MHSTTYGMSPSLYDDVVKRLRGGEGVVEVFENLRHLDMTVDEVYAVWKDLHDHGLVLTSPYSMVQERVRGSSDYPWKVIVLSALMNRTHARQVRPIVRPLFFAWPTPVSMAKASSDLEDLIRPLGFVNRRAKALREMSHDYATGRSPYDCRGVGRFGKDALDVFVEGRTDIRPDDRFLTKYVEWKRTGRCEWSK